MKKFSTMEDSIEYHDHKSVKLNKRVLYLLLFLLLVLPVIVGVLVWYFIPKCSDEPADAPGVTGGIAGDGKTTMSPNDAEPWKNLRLPRNIVPIHYDITLFSDFYGDHGWFYGNSSVEIKVLHETHFILIHVNFLNITKTILRDNATKEEIAIRRKFLYEPNQFWVVETEKDLSSSSGAILEMQYDGSLTRSIVGLYKSRYVNSITKETRYLATSKFQPVDARRAFPCFDEPNFKAQYTVHLVHEPGYTALSNMPKISTVQWVHNPKLEITNFQRSVDMSTYLVCFIVCDFAYLETTTKKGIPVRTFATPDRVNQTKFALEVAVKSMELYEELFGVPYPLPKQDMIAIPDFVSGAMEHWGLITYREVYMLFDPTEASPGNQQRVASVVAHEIAHMWFGNIVTNDWWDDLWLNEGFASFMEYLGANISEPSWNMMEQFITEDAQPVMITDAGRTSHPIVVDVTDPDQINEVFDSISYSKGASVIRMLQAIMGKSRFFEGIGKYLEKYKWSNAKTDDLWAELGMVDQTAGLSVKDVMDTWTRQMGFPYITVDFVENKVKATQKRFLADGGDDFNVTESPYGYKWFVSLDYMTNTGGRGRHWMNKNEDSIEFQLDNSITGTSNTWVKFNVEQTGFYRVKYPDFMWQRFSNMLNTIGPKALADAEKSGLINDAMSLARAGKLDYGIALGMTQYLNQENGYLPWETIYMAFEYISDMFQSSGFFGPWRNYVISKAKPVLQRIGWDDTGSHLQRLLRTNLIALTCGVGDAECLDNATMIFRNWINGKASISPNTRSLVYRYGIQNGGTEDDWTIMWNKYTTETVPQEQIKLLYGMAHTRDVWLLNRYLNYARNESMVRSQDFFTVLRFISLNPVGQQVVWDWTRQNWDYLVGRFTLYSRYLGRLVPYVVSHFNTEFKLQQVEEFFEKYPEAGAGARAREQTLESIKRNIKWMTKHQKDIVDWLCAQPCNSQTCY